ncbi:MAG: glycine zipper 2TM domain-containing protein [Gammaproteobacteria bacterium]|nr:glycine zipper 2TM domain-containing protein [Gammaproteobacteria bacterium]NNF61279.1 glycine zipper 2TM domain-containing protein [Gammaproteobacteria bacterium]
MLKKIAMTTAAFATLTLSAAALADHDWWDDNDDDDRYEQDYDRANYDYDDGYVYARVIDVDPIYRYVRIRQPQRECYDQEVYHRPRRGNYRNSTAATVTGGIIGGAIGRQFGDGKGRDAMTLIGTLVGSAVAQNEVNRDNYRSDYRDHARYRTVERCTTRYTTRQERRVEGYNVTYEFAGREYTTRMDRQPGDEIRVRVAVTPAEYERY